MKKIRTRALTENQTRELKELTALCCSHDKIHLSCPLDGDRFYLLAEDMPENAGREALISAVAVFEQEDLWECYGFTRPGRRRRGYFGSLLELLEEDAVGQEPEPDLCFVADPNGQEGLKALEVMGAELWYEEYAMEWRVGDCGGTDDAAGRRDGDGGPASDSALRLTYASEAEDSGRLDFTAWAARPDGNGGTLECGSKEGGAPDWPATDISARKYGVEESNGQLAVGSFSLYLQPPAACLFEVEIAEPLRGRGLGEAMIRKLQSLAPALGISSLTLQVSGDNLPALGLYKKTGFRIAETLSYYLY